LREILPSGTPQEDATEKKRQRAEKHRKKPALNFLLLSAGSVFTSMMISGFLVGFILDELFDTKPLFLLSCAVLGFIGGMMKVHKLLGKMDLLEDYSAEKNKDTNEK
jgi:ATP synthase protein I